MHTHYNHPKRAVLPAVFSPPPQYMHILGLFFAPPHQYLFCTTYRTTSLCSLFFVLCSLFLGVGAITGKIDFLFGKKWHTTTQNDMQQLIQFVVFSISPWQMALLPYPPATLVIEEKSVRKNIPISHQKKMHQNCIRNPVFFSRVCYTKLGVWFKWRTLFW